MSGSVPVHWLDRVSESLRDHEDRRSFIQSAPPRYEILGEISRGGMGIVYRAWDPQLGRNVALKVLHSGDGRAAEAHERFQREAKLAAGLHHPHIVQVFDTGTWEGQDYIAMQLIEGTTLDQAKPDRKQALTCIRDAARALHYAHTQGIVHRDVKPGNLLVDGSGRVFVTDFGVARQAVVSATITSPGTVVGTPAYMSPEQAQGMPTDARSDVYSLGATLYELVTGRVPVQGREAMEVLEAVRTRDPELPTRVAPDLSKNVEAILLGAMERSPEDRYATAEELAGDIDRYLAGERPLRRPRGVTYRLRREFVRHPWRSTGAIVLCALLLGAGVFLGYFIRGYRALQHGLNSKDRKEQKRDFTVAGIFFEQARTELAAIQAAELQEAKASTRAATESEAAEKRRIEDQRRRDEQDEKDRIERERAKKDIDVLKNQAIAAKLREAYATAIGDGALSDARQTLEKLKGLDPDYYKESLPKLRTKEFAAGIAELERLSTMEASEPFDLLFKEFSGETYRARSDRENLASPAWQRALTLERLGRYQEAVDWFDQAEAFGRKDATLNERRGTCLLRLKNWKRSQNDMDLLLRRRPDQLPPPAFAHLPYLEGKKLLQEKSWTAAITQFVFATSLNPQHAPAFHDRGLARYQAGGVSAQKVLEEDLRVALGIDSTLTPDATYREIVIAFSRDQASRFWQSEDSQTRIAAWNDARRWLTLIRDKCGDTPPLAIERAKMARRLRDYDSGLRELAGPSADPDVLRLKGQLHYLVAIGHGRDARELGEALDRFDDAVMANPKDGLSLFWRGTCQHALRNLKGASVDLQAARGRGLNLPYLHHQFSRFRLAEKDYAGAVESATLALERLDALGEEEFVAGNYEGRDLSRSAALKLLERDTLHVRATARIFLGDLRTCSNDCSRILELDPQYMDALILRGQAACQDRRHADAQRDYAAVLSSTSASKEEKEAATQRRENCVNHSKE